MRTPLARPVPVVAGLDVLVELAVQVETFEQELERGGRGGGDAGAELPYRGLERASLRDLLDVLGRRHRVGHGHVEAGLERGDDLVELTGAEAPVEDVQHGALEQ